jgi:hypothetical protein
VPIPVTIEPGDAMKFGRIAQFIITGGVVGTLLPFFVSLCLFGTTLQTFVSPPQHTTAFWSGAPTPEPTPIPGPVQAWTSRTLSSGGGIVYLLWNVLGAYAGEAVALRRLGQQLGATRRAWLGAVAGCVIFMGIALLGLPR